jgi:hypothetical protein
MNETHVARAIVVAGVLVLLTALSIVTAIGAGVGTRLEVLPPFTTTNAG